MKPKNGSKKLDKNPPAPTAPEPPALPEKKEKGEKKEKRSHKAAITARANGMMRRLGALQVALQDSEAEDAAGEAFAALQALVEAIAELDDDWVRAKAGDQAFEEGQTVAVSLSWQKRYEGLFDSDELENLTIVKKVTVRKRSMYAVQTEAGAKLFVQAAHLRGV